MAISPPVDVAIVATSQTPSYRCHMDTEVSLIMSCANDVISKVGMDRHDIDFTIAGSCDYLSGMPFAFVSNLDGVGAWPPIYENHVEMDAAWALFEGWVRLQHGDINTVLVSGSGKSSPGRPREVFPLQTDPYFYAPLGLDPVSTAGLAARAMLDQGVASEEDFAQVVSRSRRDALHNPNAQLAYDKSPQELLAEPYFCEPLRKHDLPPISDGAAAVIIASAEVAGDLCDNPVWIRGIDHRMESHHFGLRDLTRSVSTRTAAERLGIIGGSPGAPLDIAELSVNYSPEEIILRRELDLPDSCVVNPSGGPLAGHPVMATGLVRVIEVANRIAAGHAGRGVAHASSGPCLQQNLLCLLEGGDA